MKLAVVLGGGGAVGIAWEHGLTLGLRDGGVDLSEAELIVGTSAGSIVGALLATGTIDDFSGIRKPADEQDQKAAGSRGVTVPVTAPPNMDAFMAAYLHAVETTTSLRGLRQSLGRSAQEANLAGEHTHMDAMRGWLPAEMLRRGWPERDHLRVTTVETESGELCVWSAAAGVPLLEAIASSCAVPCAFPLVHIHGRAYMDGGVGTPTNAMLAKGHELILIADPIARFMGGQSPLLAEQAELERDGSRVHAILPDDATASLFGSSFMDSTRHAEIVAAGRDQGRTLAETIKLS